MALAIESQQRQYGALNFNHMPYSGPQFSNPFAQQTTTGPATAHNLYATSHHNGMPSNISMDTSQHASRLNSVSSYGSIPLNSTSSGSPLLVASYAQEPLLTMPQDMLSPTHFKQQSPQPFFKQGSPTYNNDIAYASNVPNNNHPYVSTASYDNMGYAPAPVRSTYALQVQQPDRRMSQSSNQDTTRSFGDAIDASRGMIAMSQATPRHMYVPAIGRSRGSADSYGYPATHSNSSSISSASVYPAYFGGSIDSNISDYSSNGSDIESVSSRTLPMPTGLVNGMPPAPSSMMSQFSSKMSSSTAKKHKCKVCDKRFTRPSSLQTHMYSHTGEKPFACEVVGCGRHFSVVSNLRRHRKVHRGESTSDAGSDEHDHNSDE